jgi:hypothetical protein
MEWDGQINSRKIQAGSKHATRFADMVEVSPNHGGYGIADSHYGDVPARGRSIGVLDIV